MQLLLNFTTQNHSISFQKSQKYKSENATEQCQKPPQLCTLFSQYFSPTTDKNSLKWKSKYCRLIVLGPNSANTIALCSTPGAPRTHHAAALPWRGGRAPRWSSREVAPLPGAPTPNRPPADMPARFSHSHGPVRKDHGWRWGGDSMAPASRARATQR